MKLIDLDPSSEGSDAMEGFSSTIAIGPAVPNVHPRFTNQPYRIAIVGEAPGKDEEAVGRPFVGMSGRFLDDLLAKAGIIRDAVFVGNICQHRPPNNDISLFSWEGEQIKGGLGHLGNDLGSFNPNVVLLLGKTALRAALGREDISNWRGSFFVGSIVGPFLGRKCIASYHPAYCLRDYATTPILMMDIHRAKSEATSSTLILPRRELVDSPTFQECCDFLKGLLAKPQTVSPDIEGYWNNITCVCFATSEIYSFIIPFVRLTGESYWSESEEVELWRLVSLVLYAPYIKKIWQNGLYDRFCFQYGCDIIVFGNEHDTMLKFWEKYCELEKSLGFQASLLTKEPYYKFERKSGDTKTHYRYCCKDGALTYEISDKLGRMLLLEQDGHYRFNHTLLNPLLYMELRGILYDTKLATKRLNETNEIVNNLQSTLDKTAGFGLKTTDRTVLLALVRDTMCYKKDQNRPKKQYEAAYDWACRILHGPCEPSASDVGRLSIELGLSLNTKSAALKDYLYKTLGLPPQYKIDKITGKKRLSTDYESLLKLKKQLQK